MARKPKKQISFEEMVDRRPVERAPDGGLQARRHRRSHGAERLWLEAVLEDHGTWHDVVSIPPIESVDIEVQVCPPGHSPTIGARLGLPRIDAIAHHKSGVTLVEAKVDTSVSSVMAGVGQLLYYQTLAETVLGLNVQHLLLAVPFCPPLLITTIDRFKLPVRVLKATDDQFFGCFPSPTATQ